MIVPTSRHLLLCLLLSGCAMTPRTEVITVAPDCGQMPLPAPLVLEPVTPSNMGTHWELSHEDYVRLRSWVLDMERYLDDVRTLTRWVNSCFADTKAVAEPQEEKRSWWKFWGRNTH